MDYQKKYGSYNANFIGDDTDDKVIWLTLDEGYENGYTENYVKEHYNYEMTLFRNPAGIFSEQSLAVTQSLGYRSMFWSFAYADWDPDNQPDQAKSLEKLVERLHPGALYLIHAVSATNSAILGDFIDQARAKGYTFELPE